MPSTPTSGRHSAKPISSTGGEVQPAAGSPPPRSPEIQGVLKVPDAARLLNMDASALYRLCRNDKVPHIRLGKTVRVGRRWVMEQLEKAGA